MTASPARRRLKSGTVALGLTALMAASLTGCGSEPDYAAICVDPQTQQRVDDDQCDDDQGDYHGGSGFYWFYMSSRSSHPVPAVGSTYTPSYGTYNGSSLSSGGKTIARGGLPKTGGTSVKSFTKSGGFGSGFGSRGFSSS